MKKYPMIGVSIAIVFLIVLASFTNVIGVQTVEQSDKKVINDEIDQKDLLFQTIVDLVNNKEIQQIIQKYQISKKGFINPGLNFFKKNNPILTKNQLNHIYLIGLTLSKFIGKSKIQTMVQEYQLNNPEMQNEISAVIEKDAILNKEINQLLNSDCDCENDDTTGLWHFPLFCTLLIPLYALGIYMFLAGWRWGGTLCEYIGAILITSIEKISYNLQCWWRRLPENHFPSISDISPADGTQNVLLNLTELSFRLTDQDGDLMSYKVTTSPYIGEGNGTLVPNGTYAIPIHGLINSTKYTWKLYLYEGDDSGTSFAHTYTFTTAPIAPFISNPTPKHNAPYVRIYTSNVSFDLTDYQGDLMNWTVETQPDIGSGGANGVGDGHYAVAINGLEYDKTYTWFMNATDGTYWTKETYVFTITSEGLLVFEPIADTYVTDNDPDETRWMVPSIILSKKDGAIPSCWDERGLVLFDLSEIPAGTMIISANLSLYYHDSNGMNPVGREITCHRILEYWDEKTTSFNTMPNSDPVESASTNVPAYFSWVDWNVTSEVDDFINSGVANYGWMIRDYKDPVEYYCHHYYYQSNANNDYPPRLFMWFNPP